MSDSQLGKCLQQVHSFEKLASLMQHVLTSIHCQVVLNFAQDAGVQVAPCMYMVFFFSPMLYWHLQIGFHGSPKRLPVGTCCVGF